MKECKPRTAWVGRVNFVSLDELARDAVAAKELEDQDIMAVACDRTEKGNDRPTVRA